MANNIIKRKIEFEISQVNSKSTNDLAKALNDLGKAYSDAYKEAEDSVEALNKALKKKALDAKESETLAGLIKENKARENQLKLLKQYDNIIKRIKQSGNTKENKALLGAMRGRRKEVFSELNSKDKMSYVAGNTQLPKGITNELGSIKKSLESLWTGVKDSLIPSTSKLVDNAIKIFSGMIKLQDGLATYNAATSLFTNKSSRENQIKYGLNTAENYGMQTAMKMLNISDDEDLAYMNTPQRNEFLKIMNEQAEFYRKVDKSGVLQDIQHIQMEFAEMQQELANEIFVFMANNKELIIGALKGVLYITKAIMNVISFIGSIFKSSPSASTSDAINTNTSNKTVNISVKATNNNNATLSGSNANFNTMSESFWNDLGRQIAERTE